MRHSRSSVSCGRRITSILPVHEQGASLWPGRRALLLFQTRPDSLHGPLFIREFARLELGVDQVAVDTQFESPATRRNQLQLANLLLVRRQQLARQTDGLRLIISHRAVLEFYLHIALRENHFFQTALAAKLSYVPGF